MRVFARQVIALESSAGAYLDSAAEMKVVGSAAMVGSLFGGLAAHPSPEYVSVLKLVCTLLPACTGIHYSLKRRLSLIAT